MGDGFLGTRGSLVLDALFLAMPLLSGGLAYSLFCVRKRRDFGTHRKLQIGMAGILLVAVTIFECDLRFGEGWAHRAEASPYYGTEQNPGFLFTFLRIHLIFAISTPIFWGIALVGALRHFDRSPKPNAYSKRHRLWGRIAAADLFLTAVTGSMFYWLAFVAS